MYVFFCHPKEDKMRMKKVSIFLPFDVFEKFRVEASELRMSVSDILRQQLMKDDSLLLYDDDPAGEERKEEDTTKPPSEIDLAVIEILFLLRESFLERNGQILKKTHEKMEKLFGKDRKRIWV